MNEIYCTECINNRPSELCYGDFDSCSLGLEEDFKSDLEVFICPEYKKWVHGEIRPWEIIEIKPNKTFTEHMKTRSTETQNEILGVDKASQFRKDGKISFGMKKIELQTLRKEPHISAFEIEA